MLASLLLLPLEQMFRRYQFCVTVFLLLISVCAISGQRSVEDLIHEISLRLDSVEFGEMDRVSQDDLREIKNIVRLRSAFLRAQAKEEGIYLSELSTKSLYEGLATFYEYFQTHGQADLATQVALLQCKLLTVRGLISTSLDQWFEHTTAFQDAEMKKFFSDPKNYERLTQEGELNYVSYFQLLRAMASKVEAGNQTLEHVFYRQALKQHTDYQTHPEIWHELIRATDLQNGEYTNGLRELIRKGYFGKKESFRYFLQDSAPSHMVRSMVHFYFMRAFAEAYMSLYHADQDRMEYYFKGLLTDPMMHASFITFSIAAERARKAFKGSSAFRRLGTKHPLVARSLIDAGPLFVGIIVSDTIFQMVEHPRFSELFWLTKNGEVIQAFQLFFELADEVWLRKSFFARAVASTAIFSGYNLGIYSILHYGGKRSVTLSPVSSFIVFTSAFIVHDLLMEELQPTFAEWDWQDRLQTAQKIAQDSMRQKNLGDLPGKVRAALRELGVSEEIEAKHIVYAIFQRSFLAFLEDAIHLTPLDKIKLKKLEKYLYPVSLLNLGRKFKEKDALIEKEDLESAMQRFPKTTKLLESVYEVASSFEFLGQVYEGYREFLFMDVYKNIFSLEKEYQAERKPMIQSYQSMIQIAQDNGQFERASDLAMKMIEADQNLKEEVFSRKDLETKTKVQSLEDPHTHEFQFELFRLARSVLYDKEAPQMLEISNSWMSLFVDQMRVYQNLFKGDANHLFGQTITDHMISVFILAHLKSFQVLRTKQEGVNGWIQKELSSHEQERLLYLLRALDPEQKSAKLRQLFQLSKQ